MIDFNIEDVTGQRQAWGQVLYFDISFAAVKKNLKNVKIQDLTPRYSTLKQ
jgi:hypothetical protein